MDVIPADWQHRVELHLVEMKRTAREARGNNFETTDYPPHIDACDDFLHHLTATFGSSAGFDRFLKSDLCFALQDKGYAVSIAAEWDDLATGGRRRHPVTDAGEISGIYERLYKVARVEASVMPAQWLLLTGPARRVPEFS